jgi:outer membrane protein TolC
MLFLLGCAASGHDSYAALRSDADARASADARAAADDDRLLAGPLLGRAAFVRAVLDRNRSIESSRQAWRAAVARVRQAGTLPDPMFSAEAAPLTIASKNVRFGYSVMLSEQLPWPGKLSLDESVAAAESAAAKDDFEAARRELALTAATLYDQYYVATRSLEINAHHVALMRGMQGAATAQYESGRASAQDPLQAEFELTHMEHDSLVAASERDVVVAQMNELLHRDPDSPLPPPPESLGSVAAADSGDPHKLESEAGERRPDIASARERARAQGLRAQRASRESLPDFTVSTGYSSMWDQAEMRWTVGLSFNLPIVTGRRAGAVDEANAMRAEYEADAARMADAAKTQVAVALKQLHESTHVVHLYEERLVPIARDEVDAARAAFVSSQAPFGAVIDAEKNLRGVELDAQMARADWDRRRAELDRALGRIPGVDDPKEESR